MVHLRLGLFTLPGFLAGRNGLSRPEAHPDGRNDGLEEQIANLVRVVEHVGRPAAQGIAVVAGPGQGSRHDRIDERRWDH
jgi:hypothetical protein